LESGKLKRFPVASLYVHPHPLRLQLVVRFFNATDWNTAKPGENARNYECYLMYLIDPVTGKLDLVLSHSAPLGRSIDGVMPQGNMELALPAARPSIDVTLAKGRILHVEVADYDPVRGGTHIVAWLLPTSPIIAAFARGLEEYEHAIFNIWSAGRDTIKPRINDFFVKLHGALVASPPMNLVELYALLKEDLDAINASAQGVAGTPSWGTAGSKPKQAWIKFYNTVLAPQFIKAGVKGIPAAL